VSVRVRSAERGDFEAVTALLEELGRATVTDETRARCRRLFDDHTERDDASHLFAEDEGGRVIGFCSLHFRERLNYPTEDAWVPDLIVSADARRRGAGRMLLAEAERRGRERRCWQLTLESAYHRTEAHLLYGAVGLVDAGKYFTKPLHTGE
jgi:(aminoalkyl)phosphonate N-acetyltransferase